MRRALITGLLMAAGLSTPSVALAEIGRIKSVAGTATVMRDRAPQPAAPGYLLRVSDVLVTGPNGRIGITFADNSRFSIGPNSRVAVSQFEFDDTTHKGRSLTTVDRGALGVVSGQIAKENKDAMKVRTPTSLLAARGTTFVVEVP
ncbi:FecR family protein [Phenylobacterium sp.]|uniref:FecR family protein n=1 Tax=Phenylobacterium sp. TaxID=1871053 RepID=UPI00301B6DB3